MTEFSQSSTLCNLNFRFKNLIFVFFQSGSMNMKIVGQGPVFKGLVTALSKSQQILENFWFKQILPKIIPKDKSEKCSTFKTTVEFGLLKLIIPVCQNSETLAELISPGEFITIASYSWQQNYLRKFPQHSVEI